MAREGVSRYARLSTPEQQKIDNLTRIRSPLSGIQGAPLGTPFRRRVGEVTGISEEPTGIPGGEGLRSVEFTYSYEPFDPALVPYVASHGTGHADFQLFDDGWRVVDDVEFKDDREDPPGSNGK